MEIGISNNQLIEAALNAAGFLAAGLLMMVIRSMFNRTSQKQETASVPASDTKQNINSESPRAVQENPRADLEFVNLQSMAAGYRPATSKPADTNQTSMRNRREIIKMAKELLAGNNGSLAESLPLTDGELSLIKQNLNLQGAGRSR